MHPRVSPVPRERSRRHLAHDRVHSVGITTPDPDRAGGRRRRRCYDAFDRVFLLTTAPSRSIGDDGAISRSGLAALGGGRARGRGGGDGLSPPPLPPPGLRSGDSPLTVRKISARSRRIAPGGFLPRPARFLPRPDAERSRERIRKKRGRRTLHFVEGPLILTVLPSRPFPSHEFCQFY